MKCSAMCDEVVVVVVVTGDASESRRCWLQVGSNGSQSVEGGGRSVRWRVGELRSLVRWLQQLQQQRRRQRRRDDETVLTNKAKAGGRADVLVVPHAR